MSDKGNYEYPAWCQMTTALDSYEQEREAYLDREADGLGPEGKQQLTRFNKAADSLVKGVQELAGVDVTACLAELVRARDFHHGKPFDLLQEHVCITFAWEAIEMLSTARDRFLDLLLLLKDRQPCGRARAFLQRVARCYLFGFDAECVVMCRATLDQAFKAEVAGRDVERWWAWYKTTDEGTKDSRTAAQQNLWGRIRTAVFIHTLTQGESDAADAVRNRGNEAVHRDPASADVRDTVCQTVQVLDAMEKLER